MGKNKEILNTKLWAISKALDIALKIASPKTPTSIWSDTQKALRAITFPFTFQKNQFMRSQVYQKIEKLQQVRYFVTFH